MSSKNEKRIILHDARIKRQWDIQTREYASKLEGRQEGRQEERQFIFDILKQQGIDVNLIKSKLPK